jgi:hypothetical protein
MAYRTQIHDLDDDSLLQVFSCYRLEDEDNWYLRLSWRMLVQVCRRWRYLIYRLSSYLDMCLLLTDSGYSLSMDPPEHLPLAQLPLVIACSDGAKTRTRNSQDSIRLGLQQRVRVRRVALRAPSSSLCMWLEPMNKHFPSLRDLSLFSTTTEMIVVLPELFQAPDLRRLSLHGIGLPKGLSLLSSMIGLSTLSLTHIRGSCYFPPGQLVTQLQGLPLLEELSIGFAIPIPLPSSEGNPFSLPTAPVTLPALRRFTFRGEDVYLDNLVAQINTPLLKRFNLTLLFDLDFTLVSLTEFIHRTEGFGCPVARVTFNKDGASVDTSYDKEQGAGKLSLYVNCKSLDWQIHSATQFCSTLGKVLSAVEELTLDLDVDGMRSDRENALDSRLWHELLLPFTGVKKLHIGASLTQELSQVLQSVPGGLSPEPLPELQELKVHLDIYNFYANLNAKKAFSAFVETRKSLGRPVNITVHPQRPPRPTLSSLDAPTLGDPPTFYDPPTFEYVAHPPAPQPLSGSVSHHPPFPVLSAPPRQSAYNSSGPPQSMYEPSTAISIPVHPNPTLSMPYYDSSFPNTAYPPSHPETRMQRGPSYRACSTLVCPTAFV